MCRDAASLFACLLGPAALYYYPIRLRRQRRRRQRRRGSGREDRFKGLTYPWLQGISLHLYNNSNNNNRRRDVHTEAIGSDHHQRDTWLDRAMEASYDEDLSQNAFFQTLQHEHATIFDRAIGEGWILCVPRTGSFSKAALTEDDFLGHILIPDEELPGTHFHTLTDKQVRLCNRALTIDNDAGKPRSLNLLFEETFYTDDLNKYHVWCIEGQLEQETANNPSREEVHVVTSLKECRDVLLTEVHDKNLLKEVDSAIEDFERTHKGLDKECLQLQRDVVGMLYAKSLRTLLKDSRLRERTIENRYFLQTIKIAVETYILHGLRKTLPRAVSFSTATEDASLNKIIKNLHDLQLEDLGVREDLYDGVSRGKLELSRLDGYFTVLGKIGCLKRAARFVSQGETSVSSDDLLPVLVYLVVKSNLATWCAQLAFMKHFRYSANSAHEADEAGFLVTSLEAAVEHVKSGSVKNGVAGACVEGERMSNGKHEKEKPFEATTSDAVERGSMSELFQYVKNGNLKEVQKILSEKAEGASKETKLCHPLCLCEKCERSLSRSAVSATPTVLSRDDRGLTCLHVASLYGQVAVVDFLLQRGADPNDADADCITPLHCAASRGHQNTLLLLLHANADVNLVDTRGNSALHLASDHGHDACVKALLYFAEQVRKVINISAANHQGDTALHFASKWGYTGIVEILLEYGADPTFKNRRGQTPLTLSHSSHITRLLEGTASRTNTPTGLSSYGTLSYCDPTLQEAEKGHSPVKITPISGTIHRANSYRSLNARYRTITEGMHKIDRLFAAIAEGDIRLASYYLNLQGPCSRQTYVAERDAEPKFCHPLCNCEKCVNIEELSYERENKPPISINAVNSEGETALHIASVVGCTEIIQLLLDAGAKVNLATRSEGRTPLHLACMNDHVKAVKLLLNCGSCNSDAKDNARDTPLHLSARAGNVRIVEMLVRHGANHRLRNLNGFTALEEVEHMKTDDIFLSLALNNILKILKNVNSPAACAVFTAVADVIASQ